MFPGPTISTHGSNEMLVVFNSDFIGTANGFNAFYEIREAFKENIPLKGFKIFFVQSCSQNVAPKKIIFLLKKFLAKQLL